MAHTETHVVEGKTVHTLKAGTHWAPGVLAHFVVAAFISFVLAVAAVKLTPSLVGLPEGANISRQCMTIAIMTVALTVVGGLIAWALRGASTQLDTILREECIASEAERAATNSQ